MSWKDDLLNGLRKARGAVQQNVIQPAERFGRNIVSDIKRVPQNVQQNIVQPLETAISRPSAQKILDFARPFGVINNSVDNAVTNVANNRFMNKVANSAAQNDAFQNQRILAKLKTATPAMRQRLLNLPNAEQIVSQDWQNAMRTPKQIAYGAGADLLNYALLKGGSKILSPAGKLTTPAARTTARIGINAGIGAGFGGLQAGADNPNASLKDIGKSAFRGGLFGGVLGGIEEGLGKLYPETRNIPKNKMQLTAEKLHPDDRKFLADISNKFAQKIEPTPSEYRQLETVLKGYGIKASTEGNAGLHDIINSTLERTAQTTTAPLRFKKGQPKAGKLAGSVSFKDHVPGESRDLAKQNLPYGTSMGFVESTPPRIPSQLDVPFKERKFVTTLKDSPNTAGEVKLQLKGDYQPISNQKTLEAAKSRIQANPIEAESQFYRASISADKNATGQLLIQKHQAEGNFDAAVKIAEHLAEHGGTTAGQAIQILSAWDKLSPEGILHYAATEAQKAGKSLDPAFAEELFKRAQIKDSLQNGFDKNIATKEILQDIQDTYLTKGQKFIKALDEYRYGNMLSSPLTHIVNATGNAIQSTIVRPSVKLASGAIDSIASVLMRKERTQYASEVPAYYRGMFSSVGDGLKRAFDALRGGVAIENPDLAATQSKSLITKPAQLVTRALEASDQFFQTLVLGAEKESLAARMTKKGMTLDPAILEQQSSQSAKETLFRKQFDLTNATGQGWLNTTIDKAADKVGQIPGIKWFVPFIKTPTQILKQGLELTPGVGLANLPGAANKTELVAKQLIGSTVLAGAGYYAMQGGVTWAAPTNKTEKDLFYASGRQPYSVKVGDKWVSFSKLGPLAYPFAMASAMQWYTQENPKAVTKSTTDRWTDLLGGIAKFFSDQSYMKGMGDFVTAMSGDSNALANLKTNLPGQLIPAASFQRWLTRVLDPNIKDPQTITEAILQGIPGLSKNVPNKVDLQGNSIPITNPGINAVSPFKVTDTNPKNEQDYRYYQGILRDQAKEKQQLDQAKQLFGGKNNQTSNTANALGDNPDLGIKELNGTYYYSINGKVQHSDNYETATDEVIKDQLKQSDQKSKVIGDTYYYKDKAGKIHNKPKVQYEYEQADAKLNLGMDRAKGANNVDEWLTLANQKYNALESKKTLYDPETEQDEIDKITLQQENLKETATKYAQYGGFKKPSTGRSKAEVARIRTENATFSLKKDQYKRSGDTQAYLALAREHFKQLDNRAKTARSEAEAITIQNQQMDIASEVQKIMTQGGLTARKKPVLSKPRSVGTKLRTPKANTTTKTVTLKLNTGGSSARVTSPKLSGGGRKKGARALRGKSLLRA